MKCSNCGAEVSNTAKFCSECGSKMQEETVVNPIVINEKSKTEENHETSNKPKLEDNQKANILCGLSIILLIVDAMFDNNGLNGLMILASITLMIYVRVKYPNNTFGKVLMWLYILYFILRIILAIFLFGLMILTCGTCATELSHCPG